MTEREWREEFMDTIHSALVAEQRRLSRLVKRSLATHTLSNGIGSLYEKNLLYCVYKELIVNPSFGKWSIYWEDYYSLKKKTRLRPLHCDLTMAEGENAGDKAGWYYIEFGSYGNKKLKEDYDKLGRLKKQKTVKIRGRYIVTYQHYYLATSRRKPLKERINKTTLARRGCLRVVGGRTISIPWYLVLVDDGKEEYQKGEFEFALIKLCD